MKCPQTKLNGTRNMWIVKPGGLSRGRDIQVFTKLGKILSYTEIDASIYHQMSENISPTPSNNKKPLSYNSFEERNYVFAAKKNWIVQKYIENPLLIMNRKIDIRVWVVVT